MGTIVGASALVLWGAVVGLIAIRFIYDKPIPPSDLNFYSHSASNWIFAFVIIFLLTTWGLSIVIMQHNSSDKPVLDLKTEGKRRAASEMRRDQAKEWWRAAAENVPGVMFEYVRTPNEAHSIPRMSSGSINVWGIRAEDIQEDVKVLTARFDDENRQILENNGEL